MKQFLRYLAIWFVAMLSGVLSGLGVSLVVDNNDVLFLTTLLVALGVAGALGTREILKCHRS